MRCLKFVIALIVSLSIGSEAKAIGLEIDQLQRAEEVTRDGLNIFRHRTNYFIMGEPDTKVQFSFKLQFIHEWDFFLAYTQIMFWDLRKESMPFSDVNYNPEIFYRWYTDNGILKGIDIGYEHRSNGRDGLDSRSWHRVYTNIRTEFEFSRFRGRWESRLFYLLKPEETNTDIRNKLGFIETEISIFDLFPKTFDDSELSFSFIPGGADDFSQGSRELNFKFRIPIRRFNPFIYLQIYNGYNESLLAYRSNRTSYRIGFAL